MSIPIITPRRRITQINYQRSFALRDQPGAGYMFDCDEQGVVKQPEHEAGRENLRKCLDGTYDVVDKGVEQWRHVYTEPAVGRCVCGADVVLDAFTNTCDECQRDYNSSGQELAPREQWGEETGEDWFDCI